MLFFQLKLNAKEDTANVIINLHTFIKFVKKIKEKKREVTYEKN